MLVAYITNRENEDVSGWEEPPGTACMSRGYEDLNLPLTGWTQAGPGGLPWWLDPPRGYECETNDPATHLPCGGRQTQM